MLVKIKEVLCGQSGSVTADWAIVIASLFLMGVVILAAVTGSAVNLADDTASVGSFTNAG